MSQEKALVIKAAEATPARRGAGRRLAPALLLAGVVGVAVAAAAGGHSPAGGRAARGNFLPRPLAAAPQGNVAFSKFSHGTRAHATLACASCHARASNAPTPALPGHKACTDCHLQQFVTQGSPMCSICHTNLASGSPPVKAFPPLRSFAAGFDHARHNAGAARPAAGCASCHAPARRGAAALSIPGGAGAHSNCSQCHTPRARGAAGRDISSCGACHTPGRHARTPTNAKSFGVGFSHAAHGARQGLGCADCHGVRAGRTRSAQVSSPLPAQHFAAGRGQKSCASCHDNRRAFGGEDFADCKRCHRGPTFRF